MARVEFDDDVKKIVIERQRGKCGMCGIMINTQWTLGVLKGHAHHMKPDVFGGPAIEENCVYLCERCHYGFGHGTARKGSPIPSSAGSTSTWVQLKRTDYPYFNGIR